MRIISGRFKGLRLPLRARAQIRPTSERVREALFNVLGASIKGIRALDFFAGSGALGLEALSRGAGSVVFVEQDSRLTKNLSDFCGNNKLFDQTEVLNMDSGQALSLLVSRKDQFEVIFLDPPYESDWVAKLFSNRSFFFLLSPDGLLVVERPKTNLGTDNFHEVGLEKIFSRSYGSSVIEFFSLKTVESISDLEFVKSD
jgi:16S rRNA (guanine966-N2)-methyltransferase